MSDDQRDDVDYESPVVEDIDTTEGPAVTSAGSSNPV
jgi:hypothetical protein